MPRFNKGDKVHVSVIDGTVRRKMLLVVEEVVDNKSRGAIEYKLKGEDGKSYKEGVLFREKDLRRDR
jgi:hypothetical protein